MRTKAPIAAAALIALIAPPPATATPQPTGPTAGCAIEGWSIDSAGLRVRAGPSARAAVIGRLPAFVVDREGDYGPFFRIVAARNGWLRITKASDAWRPSDLPRRRVFAGSGWVHGASVRVAVQSPIGRAAPAPDAPVVVNAGDWLSERGRVTAVTGCSVKWAKVRYTLPAAPRRGPRTGEAWFTRICGDQRTTCDVAD